MAETLTANYGWTKPDPGASANTWGATLNADLDKIDAQVFANQQAGLPVGSGALWFTNTPPTNWLICNGASLATTGTYAALFAAIGYIYGGSGANFNLPNLVQNFPFGQGASYPIGASGGEAAHVLTIPEMPIHDHVVFDPTHNHPVFDPTHAHTLSADPGHTHPVLDPTHAHGGVIVQGGPGAWNSLGGSPPLIDPGISSASGTGISIQSAVTGIPATDNAVTNVETYDALTGVQIEDAGGGAAHNNLPPYLAINFIIRYQ